MRHCVYVCAAGLSARFGLRLGWLRAARRRRRRSRHHRRALYTYTRARESERERAESARARDDESHVTDPAGGRSKRALGLSHSLACCVHCIYACVTYTYITHTHMVNAHARPLPRRISPRAQSVQRDGESPSPGDSLSLSQGVYMHEMRICISLALYLSRPFLNKFRLRARLCSTIPGRRYICVHRNIYVLMLLIIHAFGVPVEFINLILMLYNERGDLFLSLSLSRVVTFFTPRLGTTRWHGNGCRCSERESERLGTVILRFFGKKGGGALWGDVCLYGIEIFV